MAIATMKLNTTESFRAQALPAPLVYVDTRVKRLIRRGAMLFDVRDAKIDVAPLEGWPSPDEVLVPPKTLVPVIAPPPEPLTLPATKTA